MGLDSAEVSHLLDQAIDSFQGKNYLIATNILFSRLAELDFPAALQRVLERSEEPKKDWLLSIFHTLASLDLSQAMQHAKELRPDYRDAVGKTILDALPELSGSDRHSIATTLQLRNMAHLLAAVDPDTAWAEALKVPGLTQRASSMGGVARELGKTEPERALALTEAITWQPARFMSQTSILLGWLYRDVEATFGWLLD